MMQQMFRVTLVGLICTLSRVVIAQDAAAPVETNKKLEVGAEKKWAFEVAPYLWFPGITGNVALEPISGHINANTLDLLSRFDMGFMVHTEARRLHIGGWFDGTYFKLSGDRSASPGPLDTKLNIGYTTWGGYYRFGQEKLAFDIMFGGRFVVSDTNVSVPGSGIGTGSAARSRSWIEPLVGARLSGNFGESKWRYSITGNVSGGGIGSDSTIDGTGLIGYRFNDLITWNFGYRFLRLDIEKKGLKNDFNIYGPITGIQFKF